MVEAPAPDARGWRAKFAVLGPSTNTIVQPDFDDLRVPGVTNHYSRILTPNAQAISNESFMAGTRVIADNVLDAVDAVMTAEPDHFVMGMSAITFYGGLDGADRFAAGVSARGGGKGVSIGSHACRAALEAYRAAGRDIRRIAFFSPYFPAANTEVAGYFTEAGFEVVRETCLECPSWTAIAKVPEARCREVVRDLDGPEVDAIVQVGTNLSFIHLAAAAERFLGKPVIAINTATYWHALRTTGIPDRIMGFGRLLEEF